jgi:hypothetical protein
MQVPRTASQSDSRLVAFALGPESPDGAAVVTAKQRRGGSNSGAAPAAGQVGKAGRKQVAASDTKLVRVAGKQKKGGANGAAANGAASKMSDAEALAMARNAALAAVMGSVGGADGGPVVMEVQCTLSAGQGCERAGPPCSCRVLVPCSGVSSTMHACMYMCMHACQERRGTWQRPADACCCASCRSLRH